MSLRPDDRSSRRRDRSHSRSRDERSRSRHDDRKRDRHADDSRVDERVVESRQYESSMPAMMPSMTSMPTMPAMPAMPPMPGDYGGFTGMTANEDYNSRGGYQQADHSRPPPSTGAVPYPTTDFLPDPDHFDITSGSSYSRLDDSLAFGDSPYQDKHRASSNPHDIHRSRADSYRSDKYGPSSGAPPPPSAFYGSAATDAQHRPTPSHRTSSYEKHRPQTSLQSSIESYQSSRNAQLAAAGLSSSTVDFTPGGRARSSSNLAPSSLTPQMNHLTIGGPQAGHGGGLPPPSPLLEAYRGTYQSVSPMVAPLYHSSDSDISDGEQLSGSQTRDFKPSKPSKSDKKDKHDKHHHSDKTDKHKSKPSVGFATDTKPKLKKSVTLYEPSSDAAALSKALSHSHSSNIDTDTITRILPELTHDQILALRKEYKTVAKVNGKGINLSKHLKLKLSGNYGKAAYVTALGRWESEGYWANFFYQSHGSRRELLIESLMGRTNAEVRAIKDEFRDKRYGDDLRKMVERELRADKFRTAVGMVLEERRQEETDWFGEEVVRKDVQTLAGCLRTREGGESAMLEVVIRRSDAHLRRVLTVFEGEMKVNFAREALKRSGNLVGEVLAHILNGVINRPARDALLLKHAIQDIAEHNKDEELRYELLISRLVRFHWDKQHLERVKREYLTKNGRKLEDDIASATKGDFKQFMVELCDPRG